MQSRDIQRDDSLLHQNQYSIHNLKHVRERPCITLHALLSMCILISGASRSGWKCVCADIYGTSSRINVFAKDSCISSRAKHSIGRNGQASVPKAEQGWDIMQNQRMSDRKANAIDWWIAGDGPCKASLKTDSRPKLVSFPEHKIGPISCTYEYKLHPHSTMCNAGADTLSAPRNGSVHRI